MYYYLYKITNKVNGKSYIGVHKTDNLNDEYMGSGKLLSEAMEKYGIENFKKKILKGFDTEEEMFNEEAEIVDEDGIARKDTYNIKLGGNGGGDVASRKRGEKYGDNGGEIVGKKGLEALKEKYGENGGKIITKKGREEQRKKYPEGVGKGRKHNGETKRKIGEINSKYQRGSGNSQYGTCGIYNDELKQNKKIKKEELDSWLEAGGQKGRKMKG